MAATEGSFTAIAKIPQETQTLKNRKDYSELTQYRPWSEQEIDQLRKLSGDHTSKSISKKIGKGLDAVQKMARKLGLPRYRRPLADGASRHVSKAVKVTAEPAQAPAKPPVTIKTYVAPSVPLRKPLEPKSKSQPSSYPPAELCPVHKCLVSNWSEHAARLGNTCKRPSA